MKKKLTEFDGFAPQAKDEPVTDAKQPAAQCTGMSTLPTEAAVEACENGCGRPAAEGFPTCCRTCGWSGGQSHGPICNERREAAALLGLAALSLLKQPAAQCIRPGCPLRADRDPWTSREGRLCCRRCGDTLGGETDSGP